MARTAAAVLLAWLCALLLGLSAAGDSSLRLQAIRVADDDGRRAADVTPEQFLEWVRFANVVYATAGISFLHDPAADFADLRSTVLNNMANNRDTNWVEEILLGNAVAERYPGKVVVFLRYGPGAAPTGGGFSGEEYNFVVLGGFGISFHCGRPATQWFAHEMGHHLGLVHTFAARDDKPDGSPAFESEVDAAAYLKKHNGAPSAFDGDRLPDTLPDPYIPGLECETTKTAVVLNGATFVLPRDNIMSYYHEASVLSPLQAAIAGYMASLLARGNGAYPTNLAPAQLPEGTVRLEAEELAYTSSGPLPARQKMSGFARYPYCPQWSRNEQLFWGGGNGASLRLRFHVAKTGAYHVVLYATLAPDFGMVSAAIDGKGVGRALDAYGPIVLPSGPLELYSALDLGAGEHSLVFRVVGKNAASAGFRLGIDCLELGSPSPPHSP